ncbi:hypothetical protein DWB61_15085 [Ancylomarina euxinus]|uniref:DUF3137 domain-containing protein n=1 Tax=Ancylomarina euxinus TaxID=2283627 RepID=A0A425XXU1_9BACT|nr:hypothetical protein [Ancylomarina euxinus]MCZ4696041.1 hypothetical protein [Ancylomarina euxinus]MUP13980.1 hypothetical protein [Ancylomarina euxinus]RRG19534.1 hypothetical protein DWB61_15085 [Ancylomarina euxinus]
MKEEKEESLLKQILQSPSYCYTDNYPKRDMWKEIAKLYHGEFKIKFNSGCELEIHQITIPYKKWIIHISVSDTRPMKFQMDFKSRLDFDLLLSWEDFIERILKKFGEPEIEIDSYDFDKRYLIKSSKPDLLKRLLTKEIQEAFLENNIYSVAYKTNSETQKAEWLSVIQRKVGDKDFIMGLINLHMLILDSLNDLKIIN